MEITPSPRPNGEGAGGEGFVLVNIGLLTPALSSLREEREKKWCVCQDVPACGGCFAWELIYSQKERMVHHEIRVARRCGTPAGPAFARTRRGSRSVPACGGCFAWELIYSQKERMVHHEIRVARRCGTPAGPAFARTRRGSRSGAGVAARWCCGGCGSGACSATAARRAHRP